MHSCESQSDHCIAAAAMYCCGCWVARGVQHGDIICRSVRKFAAGIVAKLVLLER